MFPYIVHSLLCFSLPELKMQQNEASSNTRIQLLHSQNVGEIIMWYKRQLLYFFSNYLGDLQPRDYVL